MDFLESDLSGTRQVLSHIVVLLVLDGLLQGGDHFTLSLDELHLFLDSIKMGIVDVLLSAHPLLLKDLAVHHVLDVSAVLEAKHLITRHHLVILRRMHWHLRTHERRRWIHLLLWRLLPVVLVLGDSLLGLVELRRRSRRLPHLAHRSRLVGELVLMGALLLLSRVLRLTSLGSLAVISCRDIIGCRLLLERALGLGLLFLHNSSFLILELVEHLHLLVVF